MARTQRKRKDHKRAGTNRKRSGMCAAPDRVPRGVLDDLELHAELRDTFIHVMKGA